MFAFGRPGKTGAEPAKRSERKAAKGDGAAAESQAIFVGEALEVMNYKARGTHGHIAIAVTNVDRAIYHLEKKGITFDEKSRMTDERGTKFIYIDGEFGGFPIHLTRK